MKTFSKFLEEELLSEGSTEAAKEIEFLLVDAGGGNSGKSGYKNLDAVWYQSNENGTYQYLSGEFSSPKEAADHQKAINAKGYTSAFVVTITK